MQRLLTDGQVFKIHTLLLSLISLTHARSSREMGKDPILPRQTIDEEEEEEYESNVEEDEEFYEKIEAPKFVDLTLPDPYRPDDRYWFCSRVGISSISSMSIFMFHFQFIYKNCFFFLLSYALIYCSLD